MLVAERQPNQWNDQPPSLPASWDRDGFGSSNKVAFSVGGPGAGSNRISVIALRAALYGMVCAGGSIGTVAGASHLSAESLQPIGSTSENLAQPPRRRKIGSVPGTLSEIRKRALLSWDQLAQLLSVTRRTVHFWGSGGNLSPDSEAKLQTLLDNVEELDEGRPHDLRARLFDAYDLAAPPARRRARATINPGPILEVGPEIAIPTRTVQKSYRRLGQDG